MGIRIIMFLFLVSCAWSSWGLCGTGPGKIAKAKTMAELAARYDSTSCQECHEEAYEQWENSVHACSILGVTLRTAPTILTSIDKGLKRFPYSGVKTDADIEVRHLMICAKCHLPQLDEATDDVAREIVKTIRDWRQAYADDDDELLEKLEEKISSLNIGCMVCHNKVALIHKWVDG